MLALRAALLAAAMIGTSLAAQPPAAAADEVDVTVTLTVYQEVDCPDDTTVPCPGDYYGKIAIGPHDFQATPQGDTDVALAAPHWRVTQKVDRDAAGVIPIRIELWDDDLDSVNPDDMMDISSGDGDRTLDMSLDLLTGDWTGESGSSGTWSQGSSGPRARILFDISIGSNGDVDADGIPDGIERDGIRRIQDGSVDTNLRSFGTVNPQAADPCRKTILLELDFMTGAMDGHSHAPKDAALAEVAKAFADAPVPAVPCPYAGFGQTGGVQLLIERSSSIPEAAVYTLDDLVNTRSNAANFSPARRAYFHYAMFAHDQATGSSSSGLCCKDGRDFLVTLGSWRTTCVEAGPDGVLNSTVVGDDTGGGGIGNGSNRTCDSTASGDDRQVVAVGGGAANHSVGTVRDQSGTIMHELGHALGLGHRGRDDVNHTPNYLSNMNYLFQGGIELAAGGSVLDYSRLALPTLTEATLNENSGVGGPNTLLTEWFDRTGERVTANAGGAIDWDQSSSLETVSHDVNNDSACVGPGPDGALGTIPVGDDAVANGLVHNGGNNACQTAPAGDDVRVTTGDGGTPINSICVGMGPNEKMDSTKSGDDRFFTNQIQAGPDQVCQSTAAADDIQVVPPNVSEPLLHPGWDDWSNLRYRAAMSSSAAGQGAGHDHGELDFAWTLLSEARDQELMNPDLAAAKTVDKADAVPGDALNYQVTATNVGTGDATSGSLTDTLPDGSTQARSLPYLLPRAARTETLSYTVPCTTADGTVLTNRASVSARNLQNGAERNTGNNSASASTTIHAPVMTLTKEATSSVLAGEPITYTLTYANTGSGGAAGVTLTDTLPAGVYYSPALNSGAGPRPDSVTLNANGTRTLTWSVGAVPANSGPTVIAFTARPGLLDLAGTGYRNDAALTFTAANGCTYAPVTASAPSSVAVVAPTRSPLTLGYWRTHPEHWTSETLARIQATDQRFDGANGSAPDGLLTPAEVKAVLAPASAASVVLRQQLLAVYFNLAERRINAGTAISSKTASRLGTRNVREAALYGISTLRLPAAPNRSRYSDATVVLDEINNGVSPVY